MRKALVAVMFTVLAGCGEEALTNVEPRGAGAFKTPWLPKKGVPAPLPAAHCEIQVQGVGLVDMENDYLPRVVVCENGGANLEALKAQAITARSVAYYAIETQGSICDSEGCQVYTCNNQPQAIHYQAVEETSGMYLLYNDILTYGFYVAGDNGVSPPSCVGSSGATEGWVTYNEGKTGTDVQQTALGWIHEPNEHGYGQNRGCMSQWGARCLENHNGYDVLGILRFFYGDDIMITQGAGECVLEVESGDDTRPGDEGGEGGGDPSGGEDGGEGGGEAGDGTGASDPDGGGSFDETDGTGNPDGAGSDAGLPGWGGTSEGACACRSTPRRGAWAWWAPLLLGVRRRRTQVATSTKPAKRRVAWGQP